MYRSTDVRTIDFFLDLLPRRSPLNDLFQHSGTAVCLDGRNIVAGLLCVAVAGVRLLQDHDPSLLGDSGDELLGYCLEQRYDTSTSCGVFSLSRPTGSSAHDLLDFPVPLRPTRAYLCPALSLSLALFRISIPSLFALPLPLRLVGLAADATVM